MHNILICVDYFEHLFIVVITLQKLRNGHFGDTVSRCSVDEHTFFVRCISSVT